jgi:hypothetical protein
LHGCITRSACPIPASRPQITALIFLPSFPGWLAPLAFNPARFLEFFSFAATLMGTWVGSGYLAGGYRFTATADMESSLRCPGTSQRSGVLAAGQLACCAWCQF